MQENIKDQNANEAVLPDLSPESNPKTAVSLPDILATLEGDWGPVSFYEPESDTVIRINVTYDYDYVYEVFMPEDIELNENVGTPKQGASPIATGYYDPEEEIEKLSEDGEYDSDVANDILNKEMKEIVEAAKKAKMDGGDKLLNEESQDNNEISQLKR